MAKVFRSLELVAAEALLQPGWRQHCVQASGGMLSWFTPLVASPEQTLRSSGWIPVSGRYSVFAITEMVAKRSRTKSTSTTFQPSMWRSLCKPSQHRRSKKDASADSRNARRTSAKNGNSASPVNSEKKSASSQPKELCSPCARFTLLFTRSLAGWLWCTRTCQPTSKR